jgi:hypothetical protein
MLRILLPLIFIFLVVVLPNLLIVDLAIFQLSELIFRFFQLSQDYHLLIFFQVNARYSSMVELNITEVSCIFVLLIIKTCKIHVEI